MKRIGKTAFAATAVLMLATAQQAHATSNCVNISGYIEGVYDTAPWYGGDRVIELRMAGDDKKTYYFSTWGSMDVGGHAEARSLLSMATSAQLAHAHVQMYQDQCDTAVHDNITFQQHWAGMAIVP